MRTSRFVLVALTMLFGVAEVVLADAPNTPLVVAHRGLLRHAPENTLANFRACLELRVGFEVDVQRSRDGHLVCIHDAKVDRTTNCERRLKTLALGRLKRLAPDVVLLL